MNILWPNDISCSGNETASAAFSWLIFGAEIDTDIDYWLCCLILFIRPSCIRLFWATCATPPCRPAFQLARYRREKKVKKTGRRCWKKFWHLIRAVQNFSCLRGIRLDKTDWASRILPMHIAIFQGSLGKIDTLQGNFFFVKLLFYSDPLILKSLIWFDFFLH